MMYTDGRFFTPRQQWIMQRLKFLDPHIKRRSNYCGDLDYEVTIPLKYHDLHITSFCKCRLECGTFSVLLCVLILSD